jgi:Flp pilus assembly pilin Flp
MFKKYLNDKKGQGMSEYLILTLLIAVGAIAVTQKIRTGINKQMTSISTHISELSLSDGGPGSGQGRGGGGSGGGVMGGLKDAAINKAGDMAKDILGGILN